MILFPAVDIKGGQAVRLRRGRADDSTVFSDDPVAAALQWQEQGAKFLHLVDLDGAFEGVSPNTDLVRRICEALSIPVQLGGGIRDEETAHRWLDAGVARLIIGTLALEDPARFAALCHACPGRIGVSLDAENGRLKTRGWGGDTPYTVDDVVPRLAEDGAAFLVYTDIERDGMQTGVNVPALTHLARTSKVPVIAAGGISTGEDIAHFMELGAAGVQMGSIFVTTQECDASETFKEVYIHSKSEDVLIIESPVGMPGRAIDGEFIHNVNSGLERPKSCSFHCIKTCDYTKSPYCIIKALYNAAKGNMKKGYAFAGSNAFLAEKISSVKEVMSTLEREFFLATHKLA